MKKNYEFKDIIFSTVARAFIDRAFPQLEQENLVYIKQALASEFEEIEGVDHQYMTLGDVLRVFSILNLPKYDTYE